MLVAHCSYCPISSSYTFFTLSALDYYYITTMTTHRTPVRQKPKKKDPNIVGNRRDTQVAKRVHTGTYSFSNIEQTYVWSCCMNADQHSLGCNVLKKYTHGWNYSGLSG
eukprot:TRINITY_DN6148_c0_g1_i1.p1 TRINITY_DN6148_c0_g1~~TRINITY_DN6148_c0_g1_i1.p1  ORF type:complete len:109 (+),score=0.30 TRINITY_DN6148_c0_g1_i1:52-378(+)